MSIRVTLTVPQTIREWTRFLQECFVTVDEVRECTVANLPDATKFSLVRVSNESGGYTLAFSDGTQWRRVQDRAVVS